MRKSRRPWRIEAVVVDVGGLGSIAELRSPIEQLRAAGVDIEVVDCPDGDEELALILGRLARDGIGAGLVAVARPAGRPPPPSPVGWWVTFEPGRVLPDVRSLLRGELRRRRASWLPDIDRDPAWTLTIPSSPRVPHASALLSLANGTIGVAGDREDDDDDPGIVLLSGAYGIGPGRVVRPLPGPSWTDLVADGPAPCRQVLDLRTGVLVREPLGGGSGLRTARFVSLARPGIACLRAVGPQATRWLTDPVRAPALGAFSGLAAKHRFVAAHAVDGDRCAETRSDRARIAATVRQRTRVTTTRAVLERLASFDTTPASSAAALAAACTSGFDTLLAEHRRAWAIRWRDAGIDIAGDGEAQLAVRFALFHLLSAGTTRGESAVGARDLTGLAYAGHVFWDTDVFVLPALAATLPDAARAIVEYRIRRLPAARELAARSGRRGARFPWETADLGDDVTPRRGALLDGTPITIRTGAEEEHITADVAWAAACLAAWTGDGALLTGPARALVVETARYWLSRCRFDRDGAAHIDGVIGPDEYHEGVDDNCFTNGMVRWHLRTAAALAPSREGARFLRVAAKLVTGFDTATNTHEQFAGFAKLEPIDLMSIAPPPVAADVVLGRDVVAASQISKQPDVLMLHHLLPDEMPAGSLAADLDRYLPLTAHGSSLSPAICASLLARAGRPDEAMGAFDLAARIDLDDLTGMSASGLHLATMGGLWQAVVQGFAGIHPTPRGLLVAPSLPQRWAEVIVRLRFRGTPVRVALGHDGGCIESDAPVDVVVGDHVATTPVHLRRGRQGEWRANR